eukprot:9476678-Pyramimonas_sp.AAC.1
MRCYVISPACPSQRSHDRSHSTGHHRTPRVTTEHQRGESDERGQELTGLAQGPARVGEGSAEVMKSRAK